LHNPGEDRYRLYICPLSAEVSRLPIQKRNPHVDQDRFYIFLKKIRPVDPEYCTKHLRVSLTEYKGLAAISRPHVVELCSVPDNFHEQHGCSHRVGGRACAIHEDELTRWAKRIGHVILHG